MVGDASGFGPTSAVGQSQIAMLGRLSWRRIAGSGLRETAERLGFVADGKTLLGVQLDHPEALKTS